MKLTRLLVTTLSLAATSCIPSGGGGGGGGLQTVCGNAVCETGENAVTCAADCKPSSGGGSAQPVDAASGADGNGDTGLDANRATADLIQPADAAVVNSDMVGSSNDGVSRTPAALAYVVIDGSPASEPDCFATNSPGPDLDAVALFRQEGDGWTLKGVGRPGTVVFKAGAKKLCAPQNKKTDFSQVAGPVNGHVYIQTGKVDSGYFGLSDGSVELQIGACTNATQDLTKCDGAGAVQEIKPGDQLAVYEVDTTYMSTCNSAKQSCGPQTGLAENGCKCLAESYQVWLSSAPGKVTIDLGVHTGTNQYIDVTLPK